MKIQKSFLWFGIGLMLLSVVSAVYAIEVDDSHYRLYTEKVIAESDGISFTIYNPSSKAFDLIELHDYKVIVDDVQYTGKFSHSVDDVLPMLGKLESGSKKQIKLPVDGRCNEAVTVELYTFKGRLVARYVGFPLCKISKPRPVGLLKINNCTAEYDDGTLKMKWELIDADKENDKVKLRLTSGRREATEGWFDNFLCPDLEAGKCMTEVSSLIFNSEGVFVTLHDKRKGTTVTLANTDAGVRCFETEKTVVVESVPVSVPVAAPVESEPVAETYVVKADKTNDVRVCLEGCKAENQCYDTNTRANYLGMDVYCEDKLWLVQKKDGKACSSDYECKSDICDHGVCSDSRTEKEEGLLTRFLTWLDNLI